MRTVPDFPRDPTTRFIYDGDGGRIKQLTPSGTTLFLSQAYEIAPDGTTTKYVFAGGQRLAAIDTPPGQQAAVPHRNWLVRLGEWVFGPSAEAAILPSNIRLYHPDHLGSSNVITNGAGQLVELNEHTPYGSLARHEGSTHVPQQFTGQRQDDTTGLYFYNARYYDPTLGRFTSPDPFVQNPADPQTLNRYSYVRNNPINFVDPSGYSFWSKFFGIIIGVAVAVMTGNPYLGYEYYRAVDREISESKSTGQAIVRTYAVVLAMGTASGPSDLNPQSADPQQQAANARQAGDLTHSALDAAYRTHAEETAQALVKDIGVSQGVASAATIEALTSPSSIRGFSFTGTQQISQPSILGKYRVDDAPQLFRNDPVIYQDIQFGLGAEIFPGKSIVPRGFSTGEAYAGSARIAVYGNPISNQPSSWVAYVYGQVGVEPSVAWPIYSWRVVNEGHARSLEITRRAEWFLSQRKRR